MYYDPKKVGQNIRKVRVAKEYTQERLAERADLHWTYIGQIERGKRPFFSASNLVKICDALEVRPDEILGYESIKDIKKDKGLLSAYAFFERSSRTAEDLTILVNRIVRLTKKSKK